LGYDASTADFSGSVILGKQAVATANNQFVVGSAGTNAGTITVGVLAPSSYWNVVINGTACRLLIG
jgi:hypothetical protein